MARAADLPAGYTAVNAIVAPRGAYSDTGYKPNQNSRTMMDVTVQGAGEYWFGCWDRDYKDGAFAFCNDGNSIYAGYYSAGTVPAKLGTDTNHRTVMVQTAERKWSKLPNENDPNCRMTIALITKIVYNTHHDWRI